MAGQGIEMGDLPEYMVCRPPPVFLLCLQVLGSVYDSVAELTRARAPLPTNDARGLLNSAGPQRTQVPRLERNAKPARGLRLLMRSVREARH